MEQKHPIESLMTTTMENIKDMVDVNTVIGDAVHTGDGVTIIPISRVCFGFLAGGGEYTNGNGQSTTPPANGSTTPPAAGNNKMPFAGGTGAGVTVHPMGFLVVSKDQVKLLPAQYFSPIDRVIEMLPDVVGEIKKLFPTKPKANHGNAAGNAQGTTTTKTYVDGMNVPCDICVETDTTTPTNQQNPNA